MKVTANGAGEIEKIEIAAEAIDPDDPELLADMIVGAVNEAIPAPRTTWRSRVSVAHRRLGAARPLSRLHRGAAATSPVTTLRASAMSASASTFVDRAAGATTRARVRRCPPILVYVFPMPTGG